ncbi:hypothetical protein B6D52_02830 [Candidatus Parcubacteria bacterium 4484_255]|nr:MAG: hypothetical protein B6D52_02830 [Candidatus Parcubacteria bacterium 4484_255]
MQFIICPECQGHGFQGIKKCPVCSGMGVYLCFGGYALFFKKNFSSQEKINAIGNSFFRIIFKIASFLFVLWGVVCLLKIVTDLLKLPFPLFLAPFLPLNDLWLILWSAVLVSCYLIYSHERKKEKKIKIWPKSKIVQPRELLNFTDIKNLPAKYKIEVSASFSKSSSVLIRRAWSLARKHKNSQILPIHILGAALKDSDIKLVLARLGLNHKVLREKIERSLIAPNESQIKKTSQINCGLATKKIILFAYTLAGQKGRLNLSPLEILESLVINDDLVREIFYDLEIDSHQIKNVCLWIDFYNEFRSHQHYFMQRSRFKPKGAINKAYTAIATPNLDAYSQDLTQLACNNYLQFCVNRQKEKENIFRIFSTERQSIILVGQPGVGKSTLVGGIARLMVTEDVPEILQDKRLVSLSLANLIAGASRPGDIEARLQAIINEVSISGNIVLFIKDIHNMIGVKTTQGELDISEILANALKAKSFLLIATSVPKEYHRLIEGQALGETLQKIDIEEPDKNINIQILEAHAAFVESKEQVYFSYRAIERIIDLSKRYIHDHFFPEKAVNLLKEVAIMVKRARGKKNIINSEDVAELIAQKVKIPVTKITQEESKALLGLEDRIHQRLINQNEAVNAVSAALRRARTELRNKKRPIVNLLFLGPTGVGKTELAKTVAEVYFGDEDRMIRIDMSEYQDSSSIDRLLGIATENKGGYLTEAVRRNPYSLLLLDEIEKANSDILNIFLQVMEDGRLTDALGRTIDFTNIILIGTSNAGTEFIQEGLRKNMSIQDIKEILLQEKLKPYFRPEFLNRFDGLIVFKTLGKTEIQKIAKLLLNKLSKQLEIKGITFRATEEAIQELAEAGFDPAFGARPLRRVIQEKVNNLLADFLLTGRASRRDVVILEKGGNLRVEKANRI